MKKPVNVGIPYTNEQEREWAIAQAERLGYEKSTNNDYLITPKDNCIWLFECDTWMDAELHPDDKTIPLERPEESKRPRFFGYKFDYDGEYYTKEEKEDGTIILTPKKKVKVWIEVYFAANGGIGVAKHLSNQELDEAITKRNHHGTHLEVIEREYEI